MQFGLREWMNRSHFVGECAMTKKEFCKPVLVEETSLAELTLQGATSAPAR